MNEASTPLARLYGAAMIVGPALMACSSVAYLVGAGLPRDAYGGMLQVYAMAVVSLALIGLTTRLAQAMPILAGLLSVTSVLGTMGGAVFGAASIYTAAGTPQRINELSGIGSLASDLPGILFPLSLIGIGICMLRTRLRRWNATAIIFVGVLFPLSRIGEIEALALAVDLILLVAIASIGVAMIRSLGGGRPAVDAVAETR